MCLDGVQVGQCASTPATPSQEARARHLGVVLDRPQGWVACPAGHLTATPRLTHCGAGARVGGMKRPVYGCISGGGPGITYLAGAASALDVRARVVGWSGASAGALVAAAKAFGVEDALIMATISQALGNGHLLRIDPLAVARGGVLDWEVLGRMVDKVIGPGKRMADAALPLVICVTDLDRRRPLYIDRITNPEVKVREAVMASSAFMAAVTPACRIPSLGTPLSPDVRLFCDGGYTDNTVDGVWDVMDAPRVLLRLAPDGDVRRVREGDISAIHGAVLASALYAASQPKSRRTDGLVVDVEGANDWKMQKATLVVEQEWQRGYDSTSGHVARWAQ